MLDFDIQPKYKILTFSIPSDEKKRQYISENSPKLV